MYLPKFHLTKSKHLHNVHIADCLILEKRCAKGSGAEWFKISHIPNIKINGKYIQGEDSEDFEEFDEFDDSEDEDIFDGSKDDSYHDIFHKYIPFPTGPQFIYVIFYF